MLMWHSEIGADEGRKWCLNDAAVICAVLALARGWIPFDLHFRQQNVLAQHWKLWRVFLREEKRYILVRGRSYSGSPQTLHDLVHDA